MMFPVMLVCVVIVIFLLLERCQLNTEQYRTALLQLNQCFHLFLSRCVLFLHGAITAVNDTAVSFQKVAISWFVASI